MFRRLIGLVLLLCFGALSAESLIADMHDGDLAAVQHASDGAASLDGLSAVGAEMLTQPVFATTPHSVHVCHCNHVHGGPTPTGTAFDRVAPHVHSALLVRALRIYGTRLAPQFRPPIV